MNRSILLALLFASIPALIIIVKLSAEISFTLLALTGVYLWARDPRSAWRQQPMRLYAAIVWCFFAVGMLSALLSGENLGYGVRKAGTNVHFLFAPALALVMLKHRHVARWFEPAAALGALIACAVGVMQWTLGYARSGGVTNPIFFGDISLMLGFIAFAGLPDRHGWQRGFYLLAFIAALAALALSSTRGAWLALPVMIVVTLLSWGLRRQFPPRMLAYVATALALAVVLAASTPFVQDRFKAALDDAVVYLNGGDAATSIGTRLLMWGAGLRAVPERPWLGHGVQNTQLAATAHIDDPELRRIVAEDYDHLHNEYVNTLVGKGLIGLIALAIVLLTPVVYLLRNARRYTGEAASAWLIGLQVCAAYVTFGLTNISFGMPLMNIFFVLCMAYALFAPVLFESDAGRA